MCFISLQFLCETFLVPTGSECDTVIHVHRSPYKVHVTIDSNET